MVYHIVPGPIWKIAFRAQESSSNYDAPLYGQTRGIFNLMVPAVTPSCKRFGRMARFDRDTFHVLAFRWCTWYWSHLRGDAEYGRPDNAPEAFQ